MNCYENLVMKTQMNYSRHYSTYASGGTAVVLSKQKPLPYEEQIQEFARRVQEAECIIVGGASGLSAAGGGDFYYSDTPSFREHFGKFADKYGFKGAFSGMMHRFSTRNEHWGYVATFLNTTQNAPIREPYLDLDRILQGKDFHILTTNQDTQFVKIYPEEKVSEITGYAIPVINRWCNKGKVKYFSIRAMNMIPKIYLIDFFCSNAFRTIPRKSEWHISSLQNYRRWKYLDSLQSK